MSIHHSLKSSDQNSIIKSIFLGKTLWENPDDPDLFRIIRPKPSAQVRMFRPCPGSSGPGARTSLFISGWSGLAPDHPALAVQLYKGPRRGSPQTLFLLSAAAPFAPQIARVAIWIFNQGFVVLSCAFDSPRLGTSGPLRNSSIRAGISKVFSFKILSPWSLNVGCSRVFPPVNHLLYVSRGHA